MVNAEYMREVNDSNKDGVYTVEELYGLTRKWMKLRTGDMNLVIDKILEKAASNEDPVYQRIDTEHIGVIGHSMGVRQASRSAGSAAMWMQSSIWMPRSSPSWCMTGR